MKIILIVLGVILTTVEFGLAKEKLFPLNIDEIDFNKYEIKGKQIIRIAEDIDESGNAKTIKYYEIDNGDVNITIKKELAIETRDAGIYKISGYIPDGYVKEYYESGELKALVHYSSNKRSGEYSAFSKRGNLIEEGNYTGNKITGISKFYKEPEMKTEEIIKVDREDEIEDLPKKIVFKCEGDKIGTALFSKEERELSVTIKDANGKKVKHEIGSYMVVRNIKTVKLEKDDYESIYFYCIDGGTGAAYYALYVINTKKNAFVSFSMDRSVGDSFQIWNTRDKIDKFENDEDRKEREYLVKMAKEQGYVSQEEIGKSENNPYYAYYFWHKDGGKKKDGTIRKYKGKETGNSICSEVKYNNVKYTSYFKSGVMAYDEEKNEHYVVFHRENSYEWADRLELKYPYLFIVYNHDDSLAIVNIKTNLVKDYRFVKNVKIEDKKIKIGKNEEIPYPDF